MSERSNYDIIFAGGGATACIVAARLAQADPTLKILVLEAGPHTKDVLKHVQPARYFPTLAKGGETFTAHVPKPSDKISGRSVHTVTGRCVGGGSAVNFMVYCRASASDYDDWENVHGNKGWGSKSLIPLLRKAETYEGVTANDTHGKSGPLKVSFAKSGHNVADEFLAVSSIFDKDRGPIDDLNALYAYHAWNLDSIFDLNHRFIDGKTGKRSDTASCYLYPLLDTNKNLTLLARKRVVRVIFEGKRAVGVEYVDDEGDHARALQSPSIAYATRQIVVSAGTFGSPAILERSGIGASQILRKNDVQQVVDLPGVGENLMDHNACFPHYHAADYAQTLDSIFWGNEEDAKPFAQQWTETGQGLMQHNGMDAGIRLRPTAEDLKSIGPSFTARWNSYFANAPDKPIMLMASIAGNIGTTPNIPPRKFYNTPIYTAYPEAAGYSHITSGINPYAILDYDPQYFHHESDIQILVWGYKQSRELARRMSMYRGEFVEHHPKFPEGSEAIAKLTNGPVPVDAPRISYTEADNKAIEEYVKQYLSTTWHSCGTCAMKPRIQGGVVDERLNVYGAENLKVADLSITPGNVSANTYNTVIAIGEKAAVLIAQDLGIKGVTESD
ncbi:Alcohol oxidase [Leucoagaricus sp. SymC.cos]|nr:Alcohol oxidase [Leucoagaricus sp. SymC.cos]